MCLGVCQCCRLRAFHSEGPQPRTKICVCLKSMHVGVFRQSQGIHSGFDPIGDQPRLDFPSTASAKPPNALDITVTSLHYDSVSSTFARPCKLDIA